MIWRPKFGQRVEVRLGRKALRAWKFLAALGQVCPCPHGARGVVRVVAAGPGPINCEAALDNGHTVVVPRGNLILIEREVQDGA